MDYNKWDTYYNRIFVPFHGESAGTSHYRLSEAPRETLFEYSSAGSDGISTSAAHTSTARGSRQPANDNLYFDLTDEPDKV